MMVRPILFSGPMIRAIIAGRKWQTRRVIKLQPDVPDQFVKTGSGGCVLLNPAHANPSEGAREISCPYGRPGDWLWVRETWAPYGQGAVYAADENAMASRWRPSIHMPRKLSRLSLRISAIGIERIQDITEAEAKAEGVDPKRWCDLKTASLSILGGLGAYLPAEPRYRYGFYEVWESINAKRGYGWEINPWVWVITFDRIGSGATSALTAPLPVLP